MAIGNPFGLGGTVTVGIVSARNRDINSGPYDNFIQTDASINRGNSGGPLFNMDGEVIGINTAIISPTGGSIGIGFAIPSSTAVNVIDQLRDFGETRRGWLGVRIQEVTDDIAEGLSMPSASGALVAGVTEKGPAEDAGIEPGDVILKFDGHPVAAMHDLPRMVADEPVGKEVDITVLRKGKEQTVKVKLGRLEEADAAAPDAAAPPADAPPEPAVVTGPLGLSLADLSPTLRTRFGIKDRDHRRRRHRRGGRQRRGGEARPARRRHHGDFPGTGEIGGRRAGADRPAQDRRPEIRTPFARQQGWRPALRGGDDLRIGFFTAAKRTAPCRPASSPPAASRGRADGRAREERGDDRRPGSGWRKSPSGTADHSNPLHDTLRAEVRRRRKRNQLSEAERAERHRDDGGGGFGGEPPTPERPGETPADLDGRGEGRGEGRARQADQADEGARFFRIDGE